MDEVQIIMWIETMVMHESGERRPEFVEIVFLNPSRLHGVNVEHLADKGAHAGIDLVEQLLASGIKTIVEVEDPSFAF